MDLKQQILAANELFYRSIRAGDFHAMSELWSHDRRTVCTHPGWPLLTGRDSVIESWRQILAEHDIPDIWPVDAHAVVMGKNALVLCNEQIGDVQLVASNGFVLEDGIWRMFSHHADHIPAERAY